MQLGQELAELSVGPLVCGENRRGRLYVRLVRRFVARDIFVRGDLW